MPAQFSPTGPTPSRAFSLLVSLRVRSVFFVVVLGALSTLLLFQPAHASSCVNEMGAGQLDTSFGGDGKVESPGLPAASDIAVQRDGKVVVLGSAFNAVGPNSSWDVHLARFTASGALDPTFGNGGLAVGAPDQDAFSEEATVVTVQDDGKILVGGRRVNGNDRNPDDLLLGRFLANGQPDPAFNGDGFVTTNVVDSLGYSGQQGLFDRPTEAISDLVIQDDGKIVAGGHTLGTSEGGDDFLVARYESDGQLDRSFGSSGDKTGMGGIEVTRAPGEDALRSTERLSEIALKANGEIVVVGWSPQSVHSGLGDLTILQKFSPSGLSEARTSHDRDGPVPRMTLDSAGRVLLAGVSAGDDGGSDVAIRRYGTDLALDSSFGTNGLVTLDYGTKPASSAGIGIQPGGKIVVGGALDQSANGGDHDLFTARLDETGLLDPSWGDEGTVVIDFSVNDEPRRMALALDGKVVMAGHTSGADGSDPRPVLSRQILGGGVSIGVDDPSLTEGDDGQSSMGFAVYMSQPCPVAVTVDYATANGSALAGPDYVPTVGTLTLEAGQTYGSVSVPVIGDVVQESDETFALVLSNPSSGTLPDPEGTATIFDNDPKISIGDASAAEGDTGTTTVELPVTLSSPTLAPLTVDYRTLSGPAASPSDFAPTSGKVTFDAGDDDQTISVTINGDLLDELNETFTVWLSNPSHGSVLDPQGIVTITDNDPKISIGDASVSEGDEDPDTIYFDEEGNVIENPHRNTVDFDVTFSSGAAAPLTVDYTIVPGSASAPDDFASSSGTLSFDAGEDTKRISVPVVGDTEDEGHETFTVELSNPSDGEIVDGTATGTIRDDEPDIAIETDRAIPEGDTGTTNLEFQVSLSSPAVAPITVDYQTASGTASSPADFSAASGTLSFQAEDQFKTISVPIKGDTADEGQESFTVELSNSSDGSIISGSGVGTIIDDDPKISIADASTSEGDTGTKSLPFDVTLSSPAVASLTVDYQTVDGTASSADDFLSASGTVSFSAGEDKKSVSIEVSGDTTDEVHETFTVDLSAPSDGAFADRTATGTITDDDPKVSIADASIAEGDTGTTNLDFQVSLSSAAVAPLTVNYEAVSTGSASSPDDFAAVSGNVSFGAGDAQKTISVPISGDTADEVDETLRVNLSSPSDGEIVDGTALGKVLDNEPLILIDDATLGEGSAATSDMSFEVRLSDPSVHPVKVDYQTEDGTAAAPGDFSSASGNLSFDPGQTSLTVKVPVVGDAVQEALEESFVVRLSNSENAGIHDGSATGKIRDDDPQISIANGSATEGNSGPSSTDLTVSLSSAALSSITVGWSTAISSGSEPKAGGSDFTSVVDGTLVIPQGSSTGSLQLEATGDLIYERDEQFVVSLNSTSAGEIVDAESVVTILNDDAPPTLSIGNVVVPEGNLGAGQTARLPVKLEGATEVSAEVGYETAPGTAAGDGTDYFPPVEPSAGVIFPTGTTTQQIDVPLRGDGEFEPHETFLVKLVSPTDATITDGEGQVTIRNDDLQISSNSAQIGGSSSGAVIYASSHDAAPLTLTATPLCPDGSGPSDVVLSLGSFGSFGYFETEMTAGPGPGEWTATIPASNVQNGDLQISYACDGLGTVKESAGHIVLYDPSGIITDAKTGAPVEDATVTLFTVPAWSPEDAAGGEDTGAPAGNDADPTTCETPATRGPDGFNQPAPSTGAVEADPASGRISPAVNPESTNGIGKYGWDVAEGCYFIVVEADGYTTVTSPVAGVPPEVTDLDISLVPEGTAQKPDLMLSSSDISSSRLKIVRGRRVTLTATVHNIGLADAQNITVRFLENSRLIGTEKTISEIPAGSTATASVRWKPRRTGRRTISVILDGQGTIDETNEDNNTATKVFRVRIS